MFAHEELSEGEGVNCLVREPDAGKPPVRFDERAVETGQGAAREAPATERAGTSLAAPKQPRHRSTLPNFFSLSHPSKTPAPRSGW
jgi:hypothetical protein